uniref:CMP/dCMP-type deaminase domain-containing protein n=1 Tax=Panagrolaimus sp. PS1159 TaxID=55785 RepID=A0AC35G7N5_9BILA
MFSKNNINMIPKMPPTISPEEKQNLPQIKVVDKQFCDAEDAEKLLEQCKQDEELSKSFVSKRNDYIGWEETFMGMALLAAQRSKDPVTQVGCAIINKDSIVNSLGYNGMPRGCDDDEFPWGKNPDRPFLNKHSYVVHAEENAILNSKDSLKGNILYSTHFPCNKCAKMIIQVGITEVVYMKFKEDDDEVMAAKLMFSKAGIKTRKFVPQRKQIVLEFQ